MHGGAISGARMRMRHTLGSARDRRMTENTLPLGFAAVRYLTIPAPTPQASWRSGWN